LRGLLLKGGRGREWVEERRVGRERREGGGEGTGKDPLVLAYTPP